MTPKEKILNMIPKNDEGIETHDLLELVLGSKICSRATFYRYLNSLKDKGLIKILDPNKEISTIILEMMK